MDCNGISTAFHLHTCTKECSWRISIPLALLDISLSPLSHSSKSHAFDETALETFPTNLFCPFSFVFRVDYTHGAGLLPNCPSSLIFLPVRRVRITSFMLGLPLTYNLVWKPCLSNHTTTDLQHLPKSPTPALSVIIVVILLDPPSGHVMGPHLNPSRLAPQHRPVRLSDTTGLHFFPRFATKSRPSKPRPWSGLIDGLTQLVFNHPRHNRLPQDRDTNEAQPLLQST